MKKRKLEIVVLSDIHLGTFGCQAIELNNYLKSISTKILILNGDIIDIWQFSKRYWPDTHTKVLQKFIKMIGKGTKVYYLTGNHDEILRRFVDFKMGDFELRNKLTLEINGKKAWFFHGDVFDITMRHSKWLAKLGAIGYDLLIIINSVINNFLNRIGQPKISLSHRIKNSVKRAIQFIDDFEYTAVTIALEKDYDYVVCGHIHQPCIKKYKKVNGEILTYLNSGDWIENLTALEYNNGEWELFHYKNSLLHNTEDNLEDEYDYESSTELNQEA
ncbi:MAG: UDP-2,3-diacylglucosamine diphosphatase [Candidatus Kapabacteria bacterium]|nr:UDP-2,3-diacylglucosamine diphosphatase [Candidatus Kapabacteria bacterium]